MHTINPINDLIEQTIRLYQELALVADDLHGLGRDSGAKRTILLHLYREGEIPALALRELYEIAPEDGLRIIDELIREGHILRLQRQTNLTLLLTLPGKAFAEKILRTEADFFRQSPMSLPLANVREAAATLGAFLNAMKKARKETVEARVVGL